MTAFSSILYPRRYTRTCRRARAAGFILVRERAVIYTRGLTVVTVTSMGPGTKIAVQECS